MKKGLVPHKTFTNQNYIQGTGKADNWVDDVVVVVAVVHISSGRLLTF